MCTHNRSSKGKPCLWSPCSQSPGCSPGPWRAGCPQGWGCTGDHPVHAVVCPQHSLWPGDSFGENTQQCSLHVHTSPQITLLTKKVNLWLRDLLWAQLSRSVSASLVHFPWGWDKSGAQKDSRRRHKPTHHWSEYLHELFTAIKVHHIQY